ncbi:biotin--[acetyl-CoA-carboxylase] ligase [Antrihabitans stalactiti]|uniref:biotin--[biotin carboxyl-carrier protein] ligase n=1 Tax=Antrihabitans stalactiti TaxID=2584121 RepID=A0A848KB50_9NOCA|nr:biotin--[acetyl-CoA-carboxylase] ligase [Antrihabitans stalactiti]NMN96093.1 biotin--[acetyl-CoA-carboxylase] ligase [Antrihabitans stalactiti]
MYSNLDRPPLSAADLRRGLDPYYAELEVVAETGSTNADLLARASSSDSDRTVLIAEAQTRGRGRHQRVWVSPPQAQVAMSVLLRLRGIDPEQLGWLPLVTGIAVVDTVRNVTDIDANLKWPNDVLVDGRKLCGILVEVATPGPDPAVVVGVGLNVTLSEEELPVPEATSLSLAGAEVTDRMTLVRALLRELASRLTAWEAANWSTVDLASAYRERCSTLGARVRADLPGGDIITGVAQDVDENGRLLIDGRAVSAGDVTHLRAQ